MRRNRKLPNASTITVDECVECLAMKLNQSWILQDKRMIYPFCRMCSMPSFYVRVSMDSIYLNFSDWLCLFFPFLCQIQMACKMAKFFFFCSSPLPTVHSFGFYLVSRFSFVKPFCTSMITKKSFFFLTIVLSFFLSR